MSRRPPVIGEQLFAHLEALTKAARVVATAERNFHAAALAVVLEALLVQAADQGSRVSVFIAPVEGGGR